MKIFHIKAPDATLEMERRFADLVESLGTLGISQYIVMDPNGALEDRFNGLGIPYNIQKFAGMFDLRTAQAAQQIAESFGPHLIQTHSPDSVTIGSKVQFNAVRVGFAAADEAQHKRTLAASDIVLLPGYPQQGAALDYDILPVPPLVRNLCPGGPAVPADNQKPVIGCSLDWASLYRMESIFQAMREIPDIRLRIHGRGHAQKAWLSTARLQAVHDRVTFEEDTGSATDFFAGLDLCVVPYRSGGIDRLTLEAWSCGIPVISGMPPERSPITGDQDGCLIEGNDVMAWRKALRELLGDTDKRTIMGLAGREKYAASRNADRVISSYLQAYETALRVKA